MFLISGRNIFILAPIFKLISSQITILYLIMMLLVITNDEPPILPYNSEVFSSPYLIFVKNILMPM